MSNVLEGLRAIVTKPFLTSPNQLPDELPLRAQHLLWERPKYFDYFKTKVQPKPGDILLITNNDKEFCVMVSDDSIDPDNEVSKYSSEHLGNLPLLSARIITPIDDVRATFNSMFGYAGNHRIEPKDGQISGYFGQADTNLLLLNNHFYLSAHQGGAEDSVNIVNFDRENGIGMHRRFAMNFVKIAQFNDPRNDEKSKEAVATLITMSEQIQKHKYQTLTLQSVAVLAGLGGGRSADLLLGGDGTVGTLVGGILLGLASRHLIKYPSFNTELVNTFLTRLTTNSLFIEPNEIPDLTKTLCRQFKTPIDANLLHKALTDQTLVEEEDI